MHRLFLDCEFTQLSSAAKLISLGLVAEDGREFYVELQDTWQPGDCSDFVKKIVLPQLWGGNYSLPTLEARSAIRGFLTSFNNEVEIVTDAPQFDWELFCDLVYESGRWPRNVRNFPTDATKLAPTHEGKELPHHALLDARIIAGMFASESRGTPDRT
ncbi:3'-5' exoribonuclease [Pseudomonas cichorii]|nr:3'-5' exoribonuclease [Pseudomonas cichorii]MBX8556732.1 3'-5' exoribonuclease [Pseudomonas cichorii]